MMAQRFGFLAAAFAIGAAGYGCSSSTTPATTSAGGSGAGGSATTTTPTGNGGHANTGGTGTGTGGTGTGGSVAGGSGQGGGNGDYLGAQCSADADCGAGLRCITSTANDPVLGGGPAAGYCSKDCAQDTDCPGGASICIKATDQDPTGICLLGCTLGPALTYINDPQPADKCQGREDVRCTELQAGVALCIPSCGEDIQCDGNKKCDPRSGMCVDTVSTGKIMGAACDPKAASPDCAGVCVQFTAGAGGGGGGGAGLAVCSSYCVLGGVDYANQLDCGGMSKGLCIFAAQGAGSGDYGFCTAACKAQDECDFPDFGCMTTGLTADNGFCFGGVEPCVQADLGKKCIDPQTKVEGDLVCTQTSLGLKCVDPGWPLGKFAGAGGAGGAGGGK